MPQTERRRLKTLILRDGYTGTDPFIPANTPPVRSRSVERPLSRIVLDPLAGFIWDYHKHKVYRNYKRLPMFYPFNFYWPANAAAPYFSSAGALHLCADIGLGEFDIAVHR